MVYGQGYAAADDVVGHELTHGVTEFSSHLNYYYQSGAINESFSDVFGELIDQTNGVGNDTAEVKWLLGEDIPGVGAIRDMETPSAYGDPDRMTSPNYTADASEADAGGVHTNSGVNNKAAFLITDGGTFNGRTVTGLGADQDRPHLLRGRDRDAHLGERLRRPRQRAAAGLHQPGRHGRHHRRGLHRGRRRRRGDRDGDLAAGRARTRGARLRERARAHEPVLRRHREPGAAATGAPARPGTTRRTRTRTSAGIRPTPPAAPRTSGATIPTTTPGPPRSA